ncbi:nuclear transport factor 2 family protein [Actinomadura rudentiformis]|uniref:Nuclear transport factor 2 family protein n=1 Tax=Actinomadura rudentiformis TaxID=359158 RepID=A0A6H9YVE0_9ACTN|nr:nuclear transport factor 2 family protein [Actinomadura rudentiformis]KAB2345563.1 nuclear transport factor 2 family protein [Actinomadura rudentiformis]
MSDISRATLLRAGGLSAAAAAAAAAVGSATPAAAAGREHPHVTLIRNYYAAYAAGDTAAMRERFFAPDIMWTIPGHHPLAGTKRGVNEVIAFFEQLGRAGMKAEPIFLAADGDWVVDLHRGWSTTPEGLDQVWALAFRIKNGRIVEAVNYPGDQHAADAYFWRVYPLAPIPKRLARSPR